MFKKIDPASAALFIAWIALAFSAGAIVEDYRINSILNRIRKSA